MPFTSPVAYLRDGSTQKKVLNYVTFFAGNSPLPCFALAPGGLIAGATFSHALQEYKGRAEGGWREMMGVLRKTWHTGLNHELQSAFGPKLRLFFANVYALFVHSPSPVLFFLQIIGWSTGCLVFTRLETDAEQLEVQ